MPFMPKYTITQTILNNLTAIAAAREVIEQAPLLPKRESSFRRHARIRNTHASTAIEGNKLTLAQVEALADGKDIPAVDKDKNEVLNYLAALDGLDSIVKTGKIEVKDILAIHGLVARNVLSDRRHCGVFRGIQVFVGKRTFDGTGYKEEVDYVPPAPEEVPRLVEKFVSWLNSKKARETNPVLLAGISHYEIARIHPFVDGNGRTARLIASLVFYLSSFDHRRLFALDDFYDRDRKAYYSALKTVQANAGDITEWLEYFSTGVEQSVGEVKNAILNLGRRDKAARHSQISLTNRQMEIVAFINKNHKAASKDFQRLFGISAQAVHKELVKLADLQIIKRAGAGRSSHYVLT